MTVQRTFVSWRRIGLSRAIATAPPAAASRARFPVAVGVGDGGDPVEMPVELYGPGDVTGIDPREIVRTEPADGSSDFDPSFLAYLELASPELPWRFTPSPPNQTSFPDASRPSDATAVFTTERFLQPWIALVAVPADLAVITPAPAGGLPTLVCDTEKLPDPAESWGWAHIQRTDPDGGPSPRSSTIARLICPSHLAPSTRYIAALVPTFAAGRPDRRPDRPPLAPAWGDGPRSALPVYYAFSFSTGAANVSFEALARRLTPRRAPDGSIGRGIDVSAPGWGISEQPRAPLTMPGLLIPAAEDTAHPVDVALAAELVAAVSTDGPGVQLRAPIYGQDYAGGVTRVTGDATSGWLDELNTDPRHRLVAGFAGLAVVANQDDLADTAWRQLPASFAQRQTTDPQLCAELGGRLAARSTQSGEPSVPTALTRLMRASRTSILGRYLTGGTRLRRQLESVAAESDPEQRDAFAPSFDETGYEYLRATAPEWILPGVDDVPTNSVVLLKSNGAFVEAFMIGLNHAVARELVWRRYPLDQTRLMFRTFWPSGDDDRLPETLAGWSGTALGTHLSRLDQLVLLITGDLLRRYPHTNIYLTGRDTSGERHPVSPTLRISLRPGVDCLGFPVTAQQVLQGGPLENAGNGPWEWTIILEESVEHTRFGCDDSTTDAAEPSWQDLGWDDPRLRDELHVPLAALAGISRRLVHSGPNGAQQPAATWASCSAHMAAILQQPAFQLDIPVRDWLEVPPPPPPGHGEEPR